MTDVGRAWTPKEAGRHEFRWPRAERERKPRDGAPRAQIRAGTLKRARRDSCTDEALPTNSMGGRRRTNVLRAARSIANGFRGEFKIKQDGVALETNKDWCRMELRLRSFYHRWGRKIKSVSIVSSWILFLFLYSVSIILSGFFFSKNK